MNSLSKNLPSLGTMLMLALITPACGETDLIDPAALAGPEDVGALELALTGTPADAACLQVTVAGSRTVRQLFPLRPGTEAGFVIDRLPLGVASVGGQAFSAACSELLADTGPGWVSETPADVRIDPGQVNRAALKLIRNGKLSVGVDFERPPWVSPSRDPIELAIIGDTPYGVAQVVDFPNLVAHINADPKIRTVVHLGDIKNGSTRCDTSYFQKVFDDVTGFRDPFIYTPGDNEWTDCHRANNGAYDPLERLDVLRAVFFPVPGLALGGGRKQVATQASLPGFSKFVENQLWFESGVAFSVLHAVGSNNNLAPWFGDDTTGTKQDDPVRRQAEVAERIPATVDWLDRTFALASEQDAAGVLLMMQADTWVSGIVAGTARHDGFDAIIRRMADLSRSFGKPVLLLQGDSHRYLVDRPLAAPDAVYGIATPVPNLERVVVEGETTSEWLRLRVDPRATAPFSWERIVR
jgi:hypothetical protein